MAESNNNSPRPLGEGQGVRAADVGQVANLSNQGPGARAAGGSWRGNPYFQAALTYPRRLFATKLRILFVLLMTFPCVTMFSIFAQIRPRAFSDKSWVMALVPIVWLAGLLAMHVKEQFAAPRVHLTPHFRRVHIIVAAAATLILVFGIYVLLALLGNVWTIGLLAIIAALCGIMYWFALAWTNWVLAAVFFQLFITGSSGARDVLQLIVIGQFEAQAAGILLCGAALIVAAGVRCFRLNEDMPEYHRRTLAQLQKERMSGQANYEGPLPRGLTDMLRAQAVAHLVRHVRRADRSPWSRICRWQAGTATGWRVWLWGLFPLAMLLFLEWYIPQRTPGAKPNVLVANSFFFLPLMLCMGYLLGLFMQRMRTAGFELMLPVGRRDYVRQVGGASALGFYQLVGVLYLSTLFWWLALAKTQPPLGYVCGAAAVGLLILTAIFGITAFVASLTRSPIILAVPFVMLAFGSGLLMQFGCDDSSCTLRTGIIPAAIAMAAVGVLLGYCAYRRWLAADFD
jgi:hypothetical protein